MADKNQSNPYQEIIDKIRQEKWGQRQDSTLDQLNDILPLVYAVGCYDAGELIRRSILGGHIVPTQVH